MSAPGISKPVMTCAGMRGHVVTMVGTGASAPTLVKGHGVTITRTGAGDYRITWGDNPGTYIATSPGLRATAEADIKNHSLIVGTYGTTAFTLDVTFWDASAVAHDLAAAEWIELIVWFSDTASP